METAESLNHHMGLTPCLFTSGHFATFCYQQGFVTKPTTRAEIHHLLGRSNKYQLGSINLSNHYSNLSVISDSSSKACLHVAAALINEAGTARHTELHRAVARGRPHHRKTVSNKLEAFRWSIRIPSNQRGGTCSQSWMLCNLLTTQAVQQRTQKPPVD